MNTAVIDSPSRLSMPQGVLHDLDPAVCAAFGSDTNTSHGHRPRAVLKPRSTDEVVHALQWANEHRVGILPVSSTGPRRRGDTVPQRDNVCMLDLSGMSSLVHADRQDRIAIVEPGVDFGHVDALLAPHGLRALRPLMPRAGKSLIASYLEREPLISPNEHWDVLDPFGGTLLVLGNGKPSPTGTAAIEGTLTQQLAQGHRHMVPVGPSNLDLLRVVQGSQGSLATMTWAAVYCERIPVQEDAWFCAADALEPVANACRDLLHRRLGNALFIVDRMQLALMLARDAAELQSLASRLPAWVAFVSVSAGRQQPQAKMAWQADDVSRCARAHGAGLHDALAGHRAHDLIKALRVGEVRSFRDRALGAHRELFFIQQLDQVGKYVDLVKRSLTSAGVADAALGVYLQPMAQGVSCHIEFTWAHGPGQGGPRDEDIWHGVAARCAQAGAFFSRPYGRWADIAYDGDTSTLPLMRMTKSILDPGGVMNPGVLPY